MRWPCGIWLFFAREGGGGRAGRMMGGRMAMPGGLRVWEGRHGGADAVGPHVRMTGGTDGDSAPWDAAWVCAALG